MGGLHFFDAHTGVELSTSNPTVKAANDLVFTPDSRCLVVATEDGVRFFDPLTGYESFGPLDGGQGAVKSLAVSRDGTHLATGGADGTVLLWDFRRALRNGLASQEGHMPLVLEQRERLWLELGALDPEVSFAAVSAFLEGGKGSVAFLRKRLLSKEQPIGDPEQRRLLKQLADPDYKERGKAFVGLKKIGRAAEPMLREANRTEKDEIMHLRLRAFLNELELDAIITPKDERMRELRVVQLLELMATPEADELLRDLKKPAPERLPAPTEIPERPTLRDPLGDPLPPAVVMQLGSARWGHRERISAVAYSRNGKRLASASWDDEWVVISDAESGKMLHRVSLKPVTALALSEDGKSLAAIVRGTWGEGAWLWTEGTEKPRELIRRTEDARSLLFHKGQLWVGERRGISCWDIDAGTMLIDYKLKTPTRVTALAYYDGAQPMVAVHGSGVLVLTASGKDIDDALSSQGKKSRPRSRSLRMANPLLWALTTEPCTSGRSRTEFSRNASTFAPIASV